MNATAVQPQTWQEYAATPGLSNSMMKDLAISPLRFWHKWVRADRTQDEPTPEMRFGSALHCAVLEPNEFLNRYACELQADDYPGCLVTIGDLRQWLKDKGITPKGTLKADVIAQVQSVDSSVPILDVIERRHFAQNADKVLFKPEDWARIYGAAESLRSEPLVQDILRDGQAEVSLVAKDPETGIRLKCRVDWLAPKVTLDLKTFTQKRGKSIDKSVTDAIWYESYYVQGYIYQLIRRIALGENHNDSEFVLAFVESDPPHEVRLRSLLPKVGGNVNLLWERARINVRELLSSYEENVRHFGAEKPWRYARDVEPLADEEVPQVAY